MSRDAMSQAASLERKSNAFQLIAILCGFSVYVMMTIGLIAFRALSAEDLWELLQSGEIGSPLLQTVAIAALVGSMAIAALPVMGSRELQPSFRFIAFMTLLCLLASVGGLNNDGFYQQTVLLFLTSTFIVCSTAFWRLPEQLTSTALRLVSYIVLGVVIAAIAYNGLPEARWVGAMHPNHGARYAFVALVFHTLSRGRLSFWVVPVVMAICIILSARAVFISCLLFCTLVFFFKVFIRPTMFHFAILFAMAIGIAGLFIYSPDAVIGEFRSLMELDSESRGLESGLTGRVDYWTQFISRIDEYVFFGEGIRSVRYSKVIIHSGLLTYFMDFGVIVGGMLLVTALIKSLMLTIEGLRRSSDRSFIAGVFCLTNFFTQAIEPDNYNLGFLGSVAFLMIVTYPVPPRERAPYPKSMPVPG